MSTLALQKPELINRLEQLAVNYDIPPESLLDRAVQEFVEKMEQKSAPQKPTHSQVPAEFLQEINAFESLKPGLIKQYRGRTVAIYQGEVIAVGDDILGLHNSVLDKFGEILCYIEWVKDDTPRKVRITSSRVKR